MAKLDAAARKAMPNSKFALPGKRFPLNDATHQRMALSGAPRAKRAGNITASQEESIESRARNLLNKGRKTGNKLLDLRDSDDR
jgi:hypothetical protein